ncbi:WecB/TagA/CpsF family glycosyltransferase [Natranaerobius thermophilus]|uniref:Glycosyl transferase, WecB/TagA/CpsF family n=1 Tax=Natranaerobius thermophilus (strain ATCC BAA-1301 / DSM 18059 / JW/NM-WN-LF) TaxID=457570 RepID=B2A0Q7_NATTJ|nr:WecB/TagA/CpsF family glycosyltransferase [Natranaerobius thermophilus]ACB85937.1 glycosyl transferase, WecB/TagA/CpsF family [Natranaerobius thermophilus JW/NM-WN-LF]
MGTTDYNQNEFNNQTGERIYSTEYEKLIVKREQVLGQPVDLLTYDKALSLTQSWLSNPVETCETKFIFAQNPEKVLRSMDEPELSSVLEEADLLIPDGSGVVWALNRKGYDLPGRVTGIDLMHRLLAQAEELGAGVYFLGGKETVINKAIKKMNKEFPGLQIKGFHHGYFSQQEEDKIVKTINQSDASLLFVAMGSPKQELFLARNRDKLAINLGMGIGGSLDVIAGEVNRAPEIFQKLKLEWFYRIVTDPKRISRGMQIPRFIGKIIFSSKEEI